MRSILVIFALEPEFAPWRRMRQFRRVQVGDRSAYEAAIRGTRLVVACVGVGAPQAEITRALAVEYRPWAGIVAGVAAGLGPELRRYEIIVGDSVCLASGRGKARSDSRLVEAAVSCGAKRVATFVHVNRIITTAEAKSRLASIGSAAEMESFAVMTRLARQGIPAAAVRVVGDTCEEDLPCNFEAALDPAGRISAWRVALQVVRRPLTIPNLVRFGAVSRRATVSLAHFLDRFAESLALQEGPQHSSLAVAAS